MTSTKLSHCAYDTHYHIVFPIKYRKSLLSQEITAYIGVVVHDIQERYPIHFESLGYDQNHIHILCSFPPTHYSGGDIVGIFKSITAKQLFKKFPAIKEDLWGGGSWSDGYYLILLCYCLRTVRMGCCQKICRKSWERRTRQ